MPTSPLRVITDLAPLVVRRSVRMLWSLTDPLARRLGVRLLCTAGRGTTDVEGPHRELRAGLADRLGCDHTDRLAEVHHRAAREIAAVALHADAEAAWRR